MLAREKEVAFAFLATAFFLDLSSIGFRIGTVCARLIFEELAMDGLFEQVGEKKGLF
jgi:hypothetical protein